MAGARRGIYPRETFPNSVLCILSNKSLFSYTSGGTYLVVFTIAAIARLCDKDGVTSLYLFNSAGVLVLSAVVRQRDLLVLAEPSMD